MKLFRSLSSKISYFTGFVIISTMLFVSVTVYFTAKASLLTHTVNNLDSNANLVANEIEGALVKVVNDVSVLSNTPPIQGIIRSSENNGFDPIEKSTSTMWFDRLATIFSSMLKANDAYTQIRYIGIANDGLELVRVNRTGHEVFRTAQSALQQKASRDYFQYATTLTQGSIAFSNINYNIENNKTEVPLTPTLRAMMPIYTDEQKIFGALIINVNIEQYLRNILLRIRENKIIYLYDIYGDLFIFNPKEKTLKFYDKKNAADAANVQASNTVNRKYNKKDYIIVKKSIYSTFEKKNKVFTMFLIANKEELFKADNEIINHLLVIIFLIALASILITYAFSRFLLKNLRKMAVTIEMSTEKTQRDMSLPTFLTDEVGVLARAFEKKAKQLHELSLVDILTGIPNRRSFIEHLDEAILRAKRNSQYLALLFVDLNNFKLYNDKYGHEFGDKMLIHFAENLKKTTRESEFCARLGGDEFLVILEGITDVNIMKQIVERFRKALNTTITIKGIAASITISIGYAIYPDDGDTTAELVKKADEQMYVDKVSLRDHRAHK